MKIQLEIKTSGGSSSFVYFESDKPEEFDPTDLITGYVNQYDERRVGLFFHTPLKFPRIVKAREWGDGEVKRGGWKGAYEKSFVRTKYQSGASVEKAWYELRKAA
jgi:hypothetical protein